MSVRSDWQQRQDQIAKQVAEGAQWSARCNCYKGHNSASGRCNTRDVVDTVAKPGEAALCDHCRTHCRKT